MINNIFNTFEGIFTKQSIIYTFKGCIAITLALSISMSLDLDKPMWALIAALFLQIRPETGFIIEKAFLLVLVSFIGVFIGFIIVNLFLPYPTLAIVSLCTFITMTMLYSTSMSHSNFVYALTLANATCMIIVFYSIADALNTTSASIFHIGYSRVTEIMIGGLSSCLVNYYIFPVKVENALKNHAAKSLNLIIEHIRALPNNQDSYNQEVENIFNSIVVLDNDLTAAKYENFNNRNFTIFTNKVIELIQITYKLKNMNLDEKDREVLDDVKNNISNLEILNINSSNFLISKLIKKFNNLIDTYKAIQASEKTSYTPNDEYYDLKNYNNLSVTFIGISRSICLLIIMYFVWINIQGTSSLLMLVILPCLLSQIFASTPSQDIIVKKFTIGMIISIPIAVLVVLNLLSQVTGYFELLILILLGSLSLGILTLTNPRFQLYSLGFCLGVIMTVQPSNHMNFEIAKAITVGLSAIIGSISLWLAFKIYPHSPYTINQKFAVKSIIKDIKKLNKNEISKQYYQACIVKKVLCILRNKKNTEESNKYIELGFKSLTKSL